jgi:hypothetical protein
MPEIRTQGQSEGDPPNSLELEYREGFGYVWPASVKQPGKWHVRKPVPCPECHRVRLDDAKQAVVCQGVRGGTVAYLHCRGCDYRWQLPAVYT